MKYVKSLIKSLLFKRFKIDAFWRIINSSFVPLFSHCQTIIIIKILPLILPPLPFFLFLSPTKHTMASSSSSDGGSPWKKHSCRSRDEPPVEKQLRNWEDLPWEVTASIFSRLMATGILMSVQFVCKSWFDICKDPLLWRRINVVNDREAAVGRLCRHAVDRSCGGLLDINIDYFGTDDLLKYITDR